MPAIILWMYICMAFYPVSDYLEAKGILSFSIVLFGRCL